MFKKLLVIGMAMVGSIFAGEFKIHDFELNHADGIYKRGEEIVVTGTLLKADKPAQEFKLSAITRWALSSSAVSLFISYLSKA